MTVTAIPDPAAAAAVSPDLDTMESEFLERDFPATDEDEAPQPAAATSTQPSAQPTAQPSPEAAATAELEALLDRPVPADERFPKMFHGRKMRDLLASYPEKDQFINTLSGDRATLRDQVIALQATLRVLGQQQQGPRGGASPAEPQAPAAGDPNSFFTRHGFKDPMREFTADPNSFFARLAHGAKLDAKAEIMDELGPRFEPIERSVGQGEDDRNIGNLRKTSDAAFDLIAEKDKITDPAIRKAARNRFDRVFAANEAALARHVGMLHKGGQVDMYNPETWVKFYRGHEEAIGGFAPLVQPGAAAVLPTGVRQNPPHSARSTASTAASGGKRVSVRQSKIVRETLKDAGFGSDVDLEDMAAQVENDIASRHERGLVTY